MTTSTMERKNDADEARQSLLGSEAGTEIRSESEYGLLELKSERSTAIAPDVDSVEDANTKDSLPRDSFSMLYLARGWREHMLPMGVFGLQMVILVFIIFNMLQQGRYPNKLNIPINVPETVRISQYIACLVSVFTADDFVTGIVHARKSQTHKVSLNEGADEQYGTYSKKKHYETLGEQRVSKKWDASNSLRLLEGLGVLAASFFFIIQSATAIDLWLNFAGVAFVGLLDDTTFILAKNGFFGPRQRSLADRVSRAEFYPMNNRRSSIFQHQDRRMTKQRDFVFAGVSVALWIGLSVIVVQQQSEMHACRSVKLTAGDPKHYGLRHYSGTYTRGEKSKIKGRSVYIRNQGKSTAVLAYCNKDNRWTVKKQEKSTSDIEPCDDFKLMSEKSRTYDITEITNLFAQSDPSEANFGLACTDCSEDANCGGNGTCNEANRSCVCDEGYFGHSCESKGPCTEIRLPEENPSKKFGFFQKLNLLNYKRKPVMVFDRPVYARLTPETDGKFKNASKDEVRNREFALVTFDGDRWVFWNRGEIKGSKESATEILAKYLAEEFGSFTGIHTLYVSESSNLASPAGLSFREHLNPFDNSVGQLGDEEFYLTCADCNNGTSGIEWCLDPNRNTNASICETERSEQHSTINRCNCAPGFSGPLCEIRPIEGTASLFMVKNKDRNRGKCTTCGSSFWFKDLNTFDATCVTVPIKKKEFKFTGAKEQRRQFGLSLNETHFGIFVSRTGGCGNGAREIYSIDRGATRKVDLTVHLNRSNGFFGEMVELEDIDCPAQTQIEKAGCGTLFNRKRKISFTQAWLHLDLRVAANKVAAH